MHIQARARRFGFAYTLVVRPGLYILIWSRHECSSIHQEPQALRCKKGIPGPNCIRQCQDVQGSIQDRQRCSREPRDALESPETKQFYNSIQLKWNFNLERAPWWGGLFERMVQSAKRCLRKTIGSAKLAYDELLTALTEVEGILNSRPLTYISSDDVEEPLTPSHLLTGFRILNLHWEMILTWTKNR